MPVNLHLPDTILPVSGVKLATISAGLKKNGAPDLVLITLPDTCRTSGVFTRNAYCAAPVTVCREHLKANEGRVRALLVNSGGANAATGEEGYKNSIDCCQAVADALGISKHAVLPYSTGVIGEQLPMDKMLTGISSLSSKVGESSEHWMSAAKGIMTTDISPKVVTREVELSTGRVTITGFAKGSGMIQPNMATMLAYLFTDAHVSTEHLNQCLEDVAEKTFNSITVDGDTSTNDSFMLCATGKSNTGDLSPGNPDWSVFSKAVYEVSLLLAQAIVRDGEGATKFITINVKGGATTLDCKQVGLTVGNSPLVKTAFFASDANLGRIIMAIGRSGVAGLDINTLSLRLGDVDVLSHGQPVPTYTDARGQHVMSRDEIEVFIDLGQGSAEWSVWACDFSHEYVSINADYRS